MTKDEELAMDLALEALEKSTDNFPANVQHRKAITAIKQALAAPVQPVASLNEVDVLIMAEAHGIDPNTKGLHGFYIDCISTTPPAAQKTWVGLTDEKRFDLWKATETDNRMVLIDVVEAELKEQNT